MADNIPGALLWTEISVFSNVDSGTSIGIHGMVWVAELFCNSALKQKHQHPFYNNKIDLTFTFPTVSFSVELLTVNLNLHRDVVSPAVDQVNEIFNNPIPMMTGMVNHGSEEKTGITRGHRDLHVMV